MNAIEEGRRWLRRAQVDLGWLPELVRRGVFSLVCFQAQQAAEKALVGFLCTRGEEAVTGHSVRRLAERAGEYDPAFARGLERWSILDSFYIPTRYPNGLPEGIPAEVYNRAAAEQAGELALEVVREVDARLSEHGGGYRGVG
ncbi:MAG: HEPN domain-containing protein [Acidobacteriota bacterium]